MSECKKVKITIQNNSYTLLTEETEKYVLELARTIDNEIENLFNQSKGLSFTEASVLTCLHFLDELRKNNDSSDHLRSQVTRYLEESAKARIEIEEYKRENERLKRELAAKN